MALLTPSWGLVLDGISSDGSTPKGLLSIRLLTKARPCDESLFDPLRTYVKVATRYTSRRAPRFTGKLLRMLESLAPWGRNDGDEH